MTEQETHQLHQVLNLHPVEWIGVCQQCEMATDMDEEYCPVCRPPKLYQQAA